MLTKKTIRKLGTKKKLQEWSRKDVTVDRISKDTNVRGGFFYGVPKNNSGINLYAAGG